jgi:hypothetical protein
VLPELTSANPLMKIRAYQIYGKLFSLPKLLSHQHLMQAVDHIFKSLSTSKDLTIKFYSAVAFSKALQIPALKPFILPNLQKILGTYLEIMQEVEHEGLIEALESIIIAFHEEISPFALELA